MKQHISNGMDVRQNFIQVARDNINYSTIYLRRCCLVVLIFQSFSSNPTILVNRYSGCTLYEPLQNPGLHLKINSSRLLVVFCYICSPFKVLSTVFKSFETLNNYYRTGNRKLFSTFRFFIKLDKA